jgi:CBS domain containing-hemolysin-like protein
MLRPDELLERADAAIPDEGPYETVGGFMMSESRASSPSATPWRRWRAAEFRVEWLDG